MRGDCSRRTTAELSRSLIAVRLILLLSTTTREPGATTTVSSWSPSNGRPIFEDIMSATSGSSLTGLTLSTSLSSPSLSVIISNKAHSFANCHFGLLFNQWRFSFFFRLVLITGSCSSHTSSRSRGRFLLLNGISLSNSCKAFWSSVFTVHTLIHHDFGYIRDHEFGSITPFCFLVLFFFI